MALLAQSEIWPIHTVRLLHGQVQLSYLWNFYLPGSDQTLDRNVQFTARSVEMPGIAMKSETYNVGGEERYYLAGFKRGGSVRAEFLELEGGVIDRFFRDWFDQVDPLTKEVSKFRRTRNPKGIAGAVGGYGRDATIQILNRAGIITEVFEFRGLIPVSLSPYRFSYEESGPLIVSVEMMTDEVRRV